MYVCTYTNIYIYIDNTVALREIQVSVSCRRLCSSFRTHSVACLHHCVFVCIRMCLGGVIVIPIVSIKSSLCLTNARHPRDPSRQTRDQPRPLVVGHLYDDFMNTTRRPYVHVQYWHIPYILSTRKRRWQIGERSNAHDVLGPKQKIDYVIRFGENKLRE